ncbi:retrovirus-related pol polyprotein from transposon tnt 1-94 [Phtheirospermum japonicum]|uniref:Retrovirus-related pol polyprotein from transposon tnt 1-94 n=1 Tax=Phtheirospermum japonicum TaxID=374723 RepID=A0A830D4Y8_9LAMI|nr:retrovirus-related pol polyprotein from transposon tnt 1-94 [Phtheirospermum japonicum]
MAKVHPHLVSPSTSPKQETFTLWMKSLILSSNGCTVFDSNGQIVNALFLGCGMVAYQWAEVNVVGVNENKPCEYIMENQISKPSCKTFDPFGGLIAERTGKKSPFQRISHGVGTHDRTGVSVTKGNTKFRQVWVRKSEVKCNMIYTSLNSHVPGAWYFDSGCSKHMTGSEDLLSNIVKFQGGKVKYGGGENGQIIGRGTLHVPGIAKLENVLLVEGLTVNLISISQLCDGGFNVKFTREKCEVYDEGNARILTGQRTSDNCYQIISDVFCRYKIVESLIKDKAAVAGGDGSGDMSPNPTPTQVSPESDSYLEKMFAPVTPIKSMVKFLFLSTNSSLFRESLFPAKIEPKHVEDALKAEYIVSGSACTQLFWMNQMIEDYGLHSSILTVLCDNTSAIDISKNPIQHSRIKHIDISGVVIGCAGQNVEFTFTKQSSGNRHYIWMKRKIHPKSKTKSPKAAQKFHDGSGDMSPKPTLPSVEPIPFPNSDSDNVPSASAPMSAAASDHSASSDEAPSQAVELRTWNQSPRGS